MQPEQYKFPTIEEIQKEELKRELEKEFLKFVVYFFEINGEEFVINWHHKVLCEVLTKVFTGELKDVIINIPPRYTKTEIVVKGFISWCIAKVPAARFLHLSYSDELALDNSAHVKERIESEEFQDFWPISLKQDSKSKKKWYTTEGGGIYATATGGQVTGFGAGSIKEGFYGAVIIDDPIKPEDARSEAKRKAINARFNNTIKSRVNSKKTPIIIIMQRVHEEDMSGFLLDGGSERNFTHINLPALNEEGPSDYDPREIGEALWPDKHDEQDLADMRKADGGTYAGQYQQRPAPAEGNLISREDIQYYDEEPTNLRMRVHSWDMTFKKTKDSDFVVGTVWGTDGKDYYLLDLIRKKMNFTESKSAVKTMIRTNPKYNAILIEDKANGTAIIDVLKREFSKVIAINPTESKEARFQAVTPMFDSRNVYLPDPSIAPWVTDFVSELLVFPNGKHDDQVDSTSQALNYLDSKTRSSIYKMTRG